MAEDHHWVVLECSLRDRYRQIYLFVCHRWKVMREMGETIERGSLITITAVWQLWIGQPKRRPRKSAHVSWGWMNAEKVISQFPADRWGWWLNSLTAVEFIGSAGRDEEAVEQRGRWSLCVLNVILLTERFSQSPCELQLRVLCERDSHSSTCVSSRRPFLHIHALCILLTQIDWRRIPEIRNSWSPEISLSSILS